MKYPTKLKSWDMNVEVNEHAQFQQNFNCFSYSTFPNFDLKETLSHRITHKNIQARIRNVNLFSEYKLKIYKGVSFYYQIINEAIPNV